MSSKFQKDDRDKLWAKLELSIQKRSHKKNKKFVLGGRWKKFVRKQGGFRVFAVDVEWIRNNLSVLFGHGGHGYVHEFIPLDEIWVATHHIPYFEKHYCLNKKDARKLSQQYFESTIIHEIAEFKEMKKGVTYWKAHQVALEKERKAGILSDPCKVYFERDS